MLRANESNEVLNLSLASLLDSSVVECALHLKLRLAMDDVSKRWWLHPAIAMALIQQ